MAIAFRSQTANVATGTSVTGVEPSGTVQNDVMVAMYIVADPGGVPGIPSGWTSIYNGRSSTNHFYYDLCYIVRGASAPSLTFTHTGSVYRELFILTFSGVDTTTPINASTNGGNFTGNPPNPDAPSATATVANTMVLAVGIGWDGSTTGGWTAPSGYVIRSDNTVSNDGVIATKALATATAEDPGAFSNAFNAGNDDGWQATVILAPTAVTPTVTTDSITNNTGTTADGNGTVSSDGGSTITERGFCWNTTGSPTISDSKVTAAGTTGSYSATMTGLSPGATYYVRAYATNANGTGYGTDISFTTVSSATVAWLRA